MTIEELEKDPDYTNLLEEVRENLSIMTPDMRTAHISMMEETLPTTFEAGSEAEFIAKQVLKYAKNLNTQLEVGKNEG